MDDFVFWQNNGQKWDKSGRNHVKGGRIFFVSGINHAKGGRKNTKVGDKNRLISRFIEVFLLFLPPLNNK